MIIKLRKKTGRMNPSERTKIDLEIAQLQKKWYKDLEFYKVAIPALAIFISLLFTYMSGILDVEKSKLELQKEQLSLDIRKFELKKDSLILIVNLKDSARARIERQLSNYELQKLILIKSIDGLKSKLKSSNTEKQDLVTENSKDKLFYQTELKKQYNNEKNRLNELDKLKSELNSVLVTYAESQSESEYYKNKYKLTEREKIDLSIIKSEASIKELEKHSNEYKNSIERLNKNYDANKKRIEALSNDDLIREFELIFLKSE